MSNRFLKNMVYPEEIYSDGKRMGVKENREEEDQLIVNFKLYYIKRS
jgi:hypothetical protein